MKKAHLIFIILYSIILYSCDKGDYIFGNRITIGSPDDVKIKYHDTTIVGGINLPQRFNIDLNEDGIDDVQFESEILLVSGIWENPRATIKSINKDVQLYGYFDNDTCYLHHYFRSDGISANSMYIYENFEYYLRKVDENDSIVSITPNFKLKPLNKGDFLKGNYYFKPDTVILDQFFQDFHSTCNKINPDTTFCKTTTIFYVDSYSFSGERINYIGLRFEESGRLGWIRAGVLSKYKILILESGLQSK